MELKVGFSGSCHWCTEAIFQSLKGVRLVEQGWVSSALEPDRFSEGVIVHFNPNTIDLQSLTKIHLHTHSCTSSHAMRLKYKSAVYFFSNNDEIEIQGAINTAQEDFEQPIITEVLPMGEFSINQQKYLNYYANNPEKPFCQTYISPKLAMLRKKFSDNIDELLISE